MLNFVLMRSSFCRGVHITRQLSIEYAKDIEKRFPLVLLNYNFNGPPTRFKIKKHGNRTSSNMSHIRSKESTRLKAVEKAKEFGFVLSQKGGWWCY